MRYDEGVVCGLFSACWFKHGDSHKGYTSSEGTLHIKIRDMVHNKRYGSMDLLLELLLLLLLLLLYVIR